MFTRTEKVIHSLPEDITDKYKRELYDPTMFL